MRSVFAVFATFSVVVPFLVLTTGCASVPEKPRIVIPEYTAAQVAKDREELASLRAALNGRSIRFVKEGAEWIVYYPRGRDFKAKDAQLLKQFVGLGDRFLEKYNRDHKIDGRLLEADAREMNQVRQERNLGRTILDKVGGSDSVEAQPAAASIPMLDEPMPATGDIPTPEELAKGKSKEDTRIWKVKPKSARQ